jgi:AraC-like DNA-binding protein
MYESYPIAAHPPRERFDFFKGLLDNVFCPMQLDAQRSVRESFTGRVEVTDLGGIKLARVSTGPLSVKRRSQDIACIGDPPYLVKFQLRGESVWSQRGRTVHMRPGDFIICSTAEPYVLELRGDYDMPVLVVARSTMRCLTSDPDQFLGSRMPGEDADCGLLSSFVGQVAARMQRLPKLVVHRVKASVLDLLGAVLSARSRSENISREQLLAQIQVYVLEHLHDRQLGPPMIAAAFGISTRMVHIVFEPEPTTLGSYIRALRVAACRRALEGAGSERGSLTEVALQYGFYDLSHMTRCFRQEYVEPPRRFLPRSRGES